MKFIYFKELQKFNIGDFLNTYNAIDVSIDDSESTYPITQEECEVIINKFIADGFAKKTNSDEYSFRFVGILSSRDICIIVYPKYFKINRAELTNSNSLDKFLVEFQLVMQVVERYKKSLEKALVQNDDEKKGEDRLPVLIENLKHYHENGLYSIEKMIIEENGEGEILWDKTINEQIAYIIDDTPYYLDYFTSRKEIEEHNIIRNIHRIVLTKISEEIQNILPIIGLEGVHLSDEEFDDYGSNEYLDYILEQEHSKQFVTDKIKILKLIAFYRDANKTQEALRNEFLFYGVKSFAHVWEDVCAVYFENHLGFRLEKIEGLKWEKGWKINNQSVSNKTLLKDIVEQPVWSKTLTLDEDDKDNEPEKDALKSTFILDTLHINMSAKRFEIYDSKYYLVEAEKDDKQKTKITGQPGIGDIAKQYFYKIMYGKLAKDNGCTFENTLIFPKQLELNGLQEDNVLNENLSVSLPSVKELYIVPNPDEDDNKLEKIETKFLDTKKAYKKYLRS